MGYYEDIYEALADQFPQNAYNIDKSRGFTLVGVRGAFVVERLNKVFGLLGYGWRFAHSAFVEHGKEVVVEVVIQYRVDSEGVHSYEWNYLTGGFEPVNSSEKVWSEPIYGVGGNSKGSGGVPTSDAQKSAVSNGLSKAASRIGVGIDAYKGNLVTDGQSVSVKEDSDTSPGDSVRLTKQLLHSLLIGSPEEYDKLAAGGGAVAAHKAKIASQIVSAIKAANLGDFFAENLAVIVGDKGAKDIENLSARNLLLVNDVAKSISTGKITWKQALEIAGSPSEKTWTEAVAEFLKDNETDDDDSERTD